MVEAMPLTIETVKVGGQQIIGPGLFIGPVNHTATVNVDPNAAGFTADLDREVSPDGYLKAGVGLTKAGVIPARASGVTKLNIAGAVAGAHVVTGIRLGDRLISVIEEEAVTGLETDLTSEFTISDDDEIDNAAGTDTSADTLKITYEAKEAIFGVTVEPVKIAASNAAADLTAGANVDVAVATICTVNRAIIEDELGRVLTANEILAYDAAGSGCKLLT